MILRNFKWFSFMSLFSFSLQIVERCSVEWLASMGSYGSIFVTQYLNKGSYSIFIVQSSYVRKGIGQYLIVVFHFYFYFSHQWVSLKYVYYWVCFLMYILNIVSLKYISILLKCQIYLFSLLILISRLNFLDHRDIWTLFFDYMKNLINWF